MQNKKKERHSHYYMFWTCWFRLHDQSNTCCQTFLITSKQLLSSFWHSIFGNKAVMVMRVWFILSAGLSTMGLYRVGGINSKVQKLMTTVFCKSPHWFIYDNQSNDLVNLTFKVHLCIWHFHSKFTINTFVLFKYKQP